LIRLLCAACALAACERPPVPERPNILLVIADDQGWPDSGFMGSDHVRTPHLDALAAGGTVFTHAFSSSSVCRPALRTMLTGLHPFQIEARIARLRRRHETVEPRREMVHFETLAKRLADRGYRTFEGGKFWEDSYELAGFDAGLTDDASRAEVEPGLDSLSGGTGNQLGRSSLDPLWSFVDAPGDAPWFVWFSPMLPHTPFDAPRKYWDLYGADGWRHVEGRIGYDANVTRLDDVIGALVSGLEARGVLDDTLVVYLSDNGWDAEGQASSPIGHALGGVRGKLSMYELGFRTPLVFHWPGVIEEGERDDRLVDMVDVVATLVDFSGAEPLPQSPGRSLAPLLTGRGGFERERVIGGMELLRSSELGDDSPDPPLVHRTEAWYLRTPEWRYVWWRALDRDALYRIDEDPFERRDLAAEHPELVKRFREEILAWVAEQSAPFGPTPEARQRHEEVRAERLHRLGERLDRRKQAEAAD
jgi:uncharacterized sulfatase